MNLKRFLTIQGVIYLFFGVGLLAAPGMLLATYGGSTDALGLYMTRHMAGFVIGIGAINLLARNVKADSSGARAILGGMLAGNALNAAITLQGSVSGLFNALVWSDPVLFIALTIGCAYYLRRERAALTTSPA